jgi:hypothetical protein
MGVFDNVQMPGAPAPPNYAAPNMAALLYQMIGGLPDDYFKGTQQGRTLNMRHLPGKLN